MKKKIYTLTLLTLCLGNYLSAQVGINAGKLSEGYPHKLADDAILHVENKTNEHKGVLLPSVSLTSVTDQTTTSGGTVTKGLLVWNDGTTLKPEGYYYWNGSQWEKVGGANGGTDTTLATITTGTYKIVDHITRTEWTEGVFCLVQTGKEGIQLPNPANYLGKIISVNNQYASAVGYDKTYKPLILGTVYPGTGQILTPIKHKKSDGTVELRWIVIGGA